MTKYEMLKMYLWIAVVCALFVGVPAYMALGEPVITITCIGGCWDD